MSGFFAGGTTAALTISNDGWWPDIDAHHLAGSLRLGDTVSEERLEVATINAVLSVNRELVRFRDSQILAGIASAADVPGEQVAGETLLIHRYRRAVYSTAGAELAERYRGLDTTGTGQSAADQLTPVIDEYRRDARWAISDILGLTRTTVELI
ncbi:head completion/stabilization protein [Pseudomonas sp. AN-1]|uniref:head completion/stabilization protein n=1 Tax=Pseudomonas sp. AN-1 TaxID=3096605 RepID=UPI002A69B08D|nr:head completion/stabilization protein [Pseudomonas sp. AN-1]WPP47717.1 head completion/stabilization protein [Pseudomonas sp. AN-1]